jgi:O-antigen/teichoic acid export membrane protein
MSNVTNRQWLKSGAYSIGSRFSVLLFGFGSFYFMVRFLSKEEFGAWSLFLTITTIIEMSRNGLIQNAIIKLIHSNDEKDINKVVTGSWMINIAYSAIIFLIIYLISPLFETAFGMPELRPMFLWYGLTLALLIPFSQFNYLQQARFSFTGIFWSAFARQGTFFVAIILIFFLDLHPSLIHLVLIQTGCTFIGLIVAFVLARSFITFRFEWDMHTTKKVVHFGKYVMGTNIASLFYKSVDQFTIGYYLNPNSVALYASAMRLSNLIEYPATSVSEVVYPHSTMRISQSGEQVVKNIYEKSLALTMAITFPIVVVTFLLADLIIYIIAGPAYAASADILRVTILFGIFTPFTRQFGMIMDSAGRPSQNFILLVGSLIVNIVLNVILVQWFGIMGAAYGTLLAYILTTIAGHIILVKLFGVEMKNVFSNTGGFYRQGFSMAREILKGNLKLR